MRLLLVLIVSACIAHESDYERLMSTVPEELRRIFPTDIASNQFSLTFNTTPYLKDFTWEIVSIYVSCNPDQFQALLKEYRREALGKYSFADSCNIIPYKFQIDTYRNQKGKEWLYNKWVRELQQCPTGYYPIPNFLNVGDDEWEFRQGLSVDYDIYVLKAEPGKNFPKVTTPSL